MLEGHYKGRTFLYNQLLMEIWEEKPDGRLVKKRYFQKWESLIEDWKPQFNCLANETINRINGFPKKK